MGTTRIPSIVSLCDYVLGDRSSTEVFLNKPHRLLDNKAPKDLALTAVGASRVENILWKIFYGIPS